MTDNNAADLHEKGELASFQPGFHTGRPRTRGACGGKVQRVSGLGLLPPAPPTKCNCCMSSLELAWQRERKTTSFSARKKGSSKV